MPTIPPLNSARIDRRQIEFNGYGRNRSPNESHGRSPRTGLEEIHPVFFDKLRQG